MRRIVRILSKALTLLSLLFAVVVVVLWVRSYWGSDFIEYRVLVAADPTRTEYKSREIKWTRGRARVVIGHDNVYLHARIRSEQLKHEVGHGAWSVGRLGARHIGWGSPEPHTLWGRLGFATWEDGWTSSPFESYRQVWEGPAWLPFTLFAIAPAAWVLKRGNRWRRYGQGRCVTCGYDLRATPERCPECGTPVGG
jgi:hypothetical protein